MARTKLEIQYLGTGTNFALSIPLIHRSIEHVFLLAGSKYDVSDLCSLGDLQASSTFMALVNRGIFSIVQTKGSTDVYSGSIAGATDETIYVNSSIGLDTNDGSTPALAFATLDKAIDMASSGWRKANTIKLAAGTYSYNHIASSLGSQFGFRSSPFLLQGTFSNELGTRTITSFTSTPATDVADSAIASFRSGTAGTFVAGAAAGQIRLSDPAMAFTSADIGKMLMIRLGNSAGNNGTFCITAVNGVANSVDVRNSQGVVVDSNNAAVYWQDSYEGSFLRYVTGTNAGQRRMVRDHGVEATGSITCVAVASLVNNDNFFVPDGVGAGVTFEYKTTGGFTPTGGRTTIDVSALGDTSSFGVAVATAAGINALLPSVLAVRASNTAGTAVVTLRNMRLGAVGNVSVTEAVANAGFLVSGFTGGFGTPLTTFRLNRPAGANPSNGDTFVIEKPASVINYGASIGLCGFGGGTVGMQALKWVNAAASPGTTAFVIENVNIYEEGVEWNANGGSVLLADHTYLVSGANPSPNKWGNQVPNPFWTAPSLTGNNFQGGGRFSHDTTYFLSNASIIAGFHVTRQVGIILSESSGQHRQGTAPLQFFDGKRTTFTATFANLHFSASTTYFCRLWEQQTVSATTGIINIAGGWGDIRQVDISGSGGDAINAQMDSTLDIVTITGQENVGVGIRALQGSQVRVTTAGLTVTGTTGDMLVGLRSARLWSNFGATAPIANEYDALGDGSRIATAGTTAPGLGLRTITSGTTSLAASTTATLATFTVKANERLTALAWVQENNAGAQFVESRVGATAAEEISYWFERTANPLEATLRARNESAATTRNLDWAVMGLVP